MHKKSVKIFISFVLLGLFLGAKGLSYHPMSHSDDGDTVSCELCEFTLLTEATSYDIASQYVVPAVTVIIPTQRISFTKSEVIIEDPVFRVLFGRPPPVVLS